MRSKDPVSPEGPKEGLLLSIVVLKVCFSCRVSSEIVFWD